MKRRKKQWSDWVRGTDYPLSATWEEWDRIHDEAKAAHPFRFWLADTAFPKIWDWIMCPRTLYWSVRHWLSNYFVTRTHCLWGYLPRGQWCDFDHRLLHCMFGGLRDYVEKELAANAYDFRGTPRQRGLEKLRWDIEESDHDPQIKAAIEVRKLYLWWMDERPKRIDPIDLAIDMNNGETFMGHPKQDYEEVWAEEQRQTEEDECMMIRLIKVSRSMWT